MIMPITRKMDEHRKYMSTGLIGFSVVMLVWIRAVVSRECSSQPRPVSKNTVHAITQKKEIVL